MSLYGNSWCRGYDCTGKPCVICREPLVGDRDGLYSRRCVSCRRASEERNRIRRKANQIGPVMRRRVIARDGHRCRYCGVAVEPRERKEDQRRNALEIDHVVPIVRGGLTVLENLVVCCMWCNRRKRDSVNFA